MPNAIDAVTVNTNAVTRDVGEPVIQPNSNTTVVPMRRGGEVVATGYTNAPVTGMGVDPTAFSRTATNQPVIVVQPVAPPEPKKDGFFKKLGRALNPATWAKKVAAKSRKIASAIGWGSTAAAGAGTVATGALLANHFAPAAVHGVLKGIGMLGLLGPHGAALGGAALIGAATVGAIGIARAFLKAGKKPAPAPKDPENSEKPKAETKPDKDENKPGLFRRVTGRICQGLGIGGGLAVGGFGLFQAGTALMGGATVAAVAPMLLVPLGAFAAGSLLVSIGKGLIGRRR